MRLVQRRLNSLYRFSYSMELLALGDVFRYQEHEYVYLVGSGEVTYAARILDEETTRLFLRSVERESARATSGRVSIEEKPVYAFVMLETPSYQGKAAHYGFPDIDNRAPEFQKLGTLIDKDIALLREEIIKSRGVPLKLKELIAE